MREFLQTFLIEDKVIATLLAENDCWWKKRFLIVAPAAAAVSLFKGKEDVSCDELFTDSIMSSRLK